MRERGPTVDELRRCVQKGRHQEIGNWLARKVARPTAVYGTWLAVRLGFSAHQVTLAALVSGLTSAVAIGSGTRAGFVAGVVLGHLAFWLDHVDGQVARWRGTSSLDGVYFDYLMHHLHQAALGFGLGFGISLRMGQPAWALAGFAIALGWTGLGLHNDCRYKAFFQRLKATSSTYRLDGGSGGKPGPAARWPRHGIGLVTWPAYKSAEPHVVLLGLSALAVTALWSESLWLGAWRAAVFAMSTSAPLLAVGRCTRSVIRGSVEEEFARWFHVSPRMSRTSSIRVQPMDMMPAGAVLPTSDCGATSSA